MLRSRKYIFGYKYTTFSANIINFQRVLTCFVYFRLFNILWYEKFFVISRLHFCK